LYCCSLHCDLHSFPTRRSSDLIDYVSFVDYHCQGHPKTCDIDRLAELARYAFAAGKRKSQSAAQRIATLVDEWRKASDADLVPEDRKSTRLNSSHVKISYAVFC